MTDNSKNNKVEIYDSTLRDGTQSQGVSLSGQDKLLIASALDELGVDYIEGGYPLSNPKDEAFFAEVRKINFKHAKLAAFGMTRRKGISAADDTGMRALLASEAPVVTIVGKSWDLHLRDILRIDEDENLAMIADSVALMEKHDRITIYDAEHFFDGWRANPACAMKTLRAAWEAGAQRLVLCDTNGGSLPEQIGQTMDAVLAELPDAKLGIHCHNDSDLAVANTIESVKHGAIQIQGTINGIGERCGNADLVSSIAILATKCGKDVLNGQPLSKLSEASRYVYEIANLNLRDNQPFVGASAFAHKGGMHVHAVQRNPVSYEHIEPQVVGNARRILVSELSGVSNIAATVPAKYNIADDKEAQRKILQTLMERENEGYQFEAAEASFDLLIAKTLGGKWYSELWKLDHYRCVIFRNNGATPDTEAIVKLTIGDKVRHTVAEGDGPVDSLYTAFRAAVSEDYPHVDDLHLVDYKVSIVNTTAGTAAKVRVVIGWHDNARSQYFGSVGVSENIIDASWLAMVDAVEYKLLKEVLD